MSFIKIKEYVSNLTIDKYENVIEALKEDNRKNVQGLARKLFNIGEKQKQEIIRVKHMYDFDRELNSLEMLAGVDEVGRGPLAGPIVAAAVILDLKVCDSEMILNINDSKKLSVKRREELSEIIKQKSIAFNIAILDNSQIDLKGVGICNQQVLKQAVDGLKIHPNFVVSDGYPIKGLTIKNTFSVKGDSKSASIACASIIAKVYRDNLMKEYSKLYPHYHFESNVGYGSKVHLEAIRKYGVTPIHRMSFLKNII